VTEDREEPFLIPGPCLLINCLDGVDDLVQGWGNTRTDREEQKNWEIAGILEIL